MTIIVNATFVNGQFQPAEPLSLPEGAEVRLEVTPIPNSSAHKEFNDDDDPLGPVIGICSSGGGKNLAEDHDLYLYGPLRKQEPQK
jgi:predicted DNA-binding antitoxin AbrB/MazE fold protein